MVHFVVWCIECEKKTQCLHNNGDLEVLMSSAIFPPLSEFSYAVLFPSSRTKALVLSRILGKSWLTLFLKHKPPTPVTQLIFLFLLHIFSPLGLIFVWFSRILCVCVHAHIPFNKIACFSYKNSDSKNHLKNKCLYLPCAFCLLIWARYSPGGFFLLFMPLLWSRQAFSVIELP